MPKIVNIDFSRFGNTQNHLQTIRTVLQSSGVIAFPTDTFYGLGANPLDEKAVEKIFTIKQRSPGKPILTLVASMGQLHTLAAKITPDAEKLIETLWPGPLTLLFRARPHLPPNLTAGSGKIGVRLPANDLTLKLIEIAGHPLTAPSANFSGTKNLKTAEEVQKSLGETVDLIVDGGPTPGRKESSILDTTVSPPELLREGEITKEEIEAVTKKTIRQTAFTD